MKTPVFVLSICAAAAYGGSAVDQFNAIGYGTLSGRLQSLAMYRDYDNGNNNSSTTLGLKLDYCSPEKSGWSIGASYIGAGVMDSMHDEPNPGDRLLANGRVNLLNEGFVQYKLTDLGLTNTTASLGRRVYHGEVFRADDFRQKPRALEAVSFESSDIGKTRIQLGHAREMSNWLDADPLWKFENFDTYGTDGVTWGEVANTSIDGLEVAAFDAAMHDLANLAGFRGKYAVSADTALLGYYRWEHDIGDNSGHDANALGLSVEQKIDGVTLEGGYFGVHGDSLVFQELTTGINHTLGASMMVYALQFNGGADTLYAKAATTIEQTRTALYALYNYTRLDQDKNTLRQAQEFNIAIKQPVPKIDHLAVALKCGIGTRDGVHGVADTVGTDARLFMTYTF